MLTAKAIALLAASVASTIASNGGQQAQVSKPIDPPSVIVERFEGGETDNDYTILEVVVNNQIFSVDVESARWNNMPEDDQILEYVSTIFTCSGPVEGHNNLYHFTAQNGTMWILSEIELEFTPEVGKQYNILYLENGTPGTSDDEREDDIFLVAWEI